MFHFQMPTITFLIMFVFFFMVVCGGLGLLVAILQSWSCPLLGHVLYYGNRPWKRWLLSYSDMFKTQLPLPSLTSPNTINPLFLCTWYPKLEIINVLVENLWCYKGVQVYPKLVNWVLFKNVHNDSNFQSIVYCCVWPRLQSAIWSLLFDVTLDSITRQIIPLNPIQIPCIPK
jgi:hypothetical protein